MKRDYWLYPEANLIVDKYAKVLNAEHLDKLDGALIKQMDMSKEMLLLVDLSDATLFNISYGDMPALYSDFLERLGSAASIKLALFSGENDRDDYMKVSTLTKYETERVQMKNFVELKDALNWLELHQDVRHAVWSNLQQRK
jgi:hypothetical protein